MRKISHNEWTATHLYFGLERFRWLKEAHLASESRLRTTKIAQEPSTLVILYGWRLPSVPKLPLGATTGTEFFPIRQKWLAIVLGLPPTCPAPFRLERYKFVDVHLQSNLPHVRDPSAATKCHGHQTCITLR